MGFHRSSAFALSVACCVVTAQAACRCCVTTCSCTTPALRCLQVDLDTGAAATWLDVAAGAAAALCQLPDMAAVSGAFAPCLQLLRQLAWSHPTQVCVARLLTCSASHCTALQCPALRGRACGLYPATSLQLQSSFGRLSGRLQERAVICPGTAAVTATAMPARHHHHLILWPTMSVHFVCCLPRRLCQVMGALQRVAMLCPASAAEGLVGPSGQTLPALPLATLPVQAPQAGKGEQAGGWGGRRLPSYKEVARCNSALLDVLLHTAACRLP